MWGIIFIIIGVIFLLKNLGLITAAAWDVIWPILLIVAGYAMWRKHERAPHLPWCQCDRCRGSQKTTE